MDSAINSDYLKEAQFYMACKLVAVYQKHINEIKGNNIHEVLPPEKIDEYISKPLDFGA